MCTVTRVESIANRLEVVRGRARSRLYTRSGARCASINVQKVTSANGKAVAEYIALGTQRFLDMGLEF